MDFVGTNEFFLTIWPKINTICNHLYETVKKRHGDKQEETQTCAVRVTIRQLMLQIRTADALSYEYDFQMFT